jgi:hypothetical protein
MTKDAYLYLVYLYLFLYICIWGLSKYNLILLTLRPNETYIANYSISS